MNGHFQLKKLLKKTWSKFVGDRKKKNLEKNKREFNFCEQIENLYLNEPDWESR